jgi:opacity protein-like surface antigen
MLWHKILICTFQKQTMKKLLLGAAFATFLTGAAFAQSGSSKGGSNSLTFGIRAGANMASIVEDDDAPNFDQQQKFGFHAGVYLTLPLADVFAIQPEVLFSQKGYRADRSFLGTNYKYRVTTNYIDVPILAKITPIKNLGILVGPQFSFLTNTKTKFETAGATFENTVDNENDNLRNNVLGGLVGLEVGLTKNVTLGARYALDFQKNNSDGDSNSLKYRNQVASLTLGFQL